TVTDTVGIITVQDGPPIDSGEIIAPEVKVTDGELDHHSFQDPEAFLALGGCRGKQLQVLTDGTFFINRWFATVEIRTKTLIPIGYVGVVVGYYGGKGHDVTGDAFRYGEQVEPGERGVWKRSLPPGKYALNPYALKVELVPTVNFVLRWITGVTEAHQYDKDLESIALITADGYEPTLPLSLVVHIDYEKAPSVVQRFGDVRRLISQTLDPILSAYFRDVAQSSNMLDLLTKREEIQQRATDNLGKRFQEYDINCIAVMIGRPETQVPAGGEDPIERLFDQLRARRLAEEQKTTYGKQQEAQAQLQELNMATAQAAKQTELTGTKVDIEISANRGEAQLAEAERLARRDVARAEGESRSQELLGRGQAAKVAQVGLSEAAVFLQKIKAYGDPRLFALSTVSDFFANSAQPIVPERLLIMGGGGEGEGGGASLAGTNVFGQLITLLLAEKAGMSLSEGVGPSEELQKFSDEMTKKFMAAIGTTATEEQPGVLAPPPAAPIPPAPPPAQ
ncbi:MAG: SPFH domain-containing protein, partial [Armatimonadota bacterium]